MRPRPRTTTSTAAIRTIADTDRPVPNPYAALDRPHTLPRAASVEPATRRTRPLSVKHVGFFVRDSATRFSDLVRDLVRDFAF